MRFCFEFIVHATCHAPASPLASTSSRKGLMLDAPAVVSDWQLHRGRLEPGAGTRQVQIRRFNYSSSAVNFTLALPHNSSASMYERFYHASHTWSTCSHLASTHMSEGTTCRKAPAHYLYRHCSITWCRCYFTVYTFLPSQRDFPV